MNWESLVDQYGFTTIIEELKKVCEHKALVSRVSWDDIDGFAAVWEFAAKRLKSILKRINP